MDTAIAESTCNITQEKVLCDVCEEKDGRYTCPRCTTKTCSLVCVKIHKEQLGCNGEKDNASFVTKSEYTNLNLLSDYRFLENINRTVDRCKTNPGQKYSRYYNWLPGHLYKLRQNARQKKINIEFLPQHFTRHQKNTTYLDFKTGIIYWNIQFVFPHGDNITIHNHKCNENDRLSTIVAQYVEVESCPDLYKPHLKFYHATGIPGLELLFKAECVKTNDSFYHLDMHSTLKDNLTDKTILEYPILFVIQKAYKDEYKILDQNTCIESIVPTKKEFLKKYTPFHFFDTVQYTNVKKKVQEKAATSIHKSCKELSKYLIADMSDGEDNSSDDTPEETIVKPTGRFNIPYYDDLTKM